MPIHGLNFGKLALHANARANIDLEVHRRLTKLRDWDLGAVSDYFAQEHGMSRAAATVFEDHYRAYIALIIMYPDVDYAMGGMLDRYWHSHLLHTIDYSRMCSEVTGFFIHHVPAVASGTVATDVEDAMLDQTRAAIARHFDNYELDVFGDDSSNCSKGCGKACGRAAHAVA